MRKKIKQANKMLSDRNNFSSHIFSFLRSMHNIKKNCILINYSKDKPTVKSCSLELAIMQSIVFSVRALETLMRDLFIYCLNHVDGFEEASLRSLSPNVSQADIDNVKNRPHLFYDYLASVRSFQSLDTVDKAFRPLYDKKFFVVVGECELPVFTYQGERREVELTKLCMNNFSPSWKTDLYNLYRERHEIVHNANHATSISYDKCFSLMNTVLIFGQVSGVIIGSLAATDSIPSTGTVTVEAPLYKVLSWNHFLKHGSPSLVKIMDKAAEIYGTEKLASIGPFIFLGTDILKCDFGNDEFSNKENVVHYVETLDNRFKIKNLSKIRQQ